MSCTRRRCSRLCLPLILSAGLCQNHGARASSAAPPTGSEVVLDETGEALPVGHVAPSSSNDTRDLHRFPYLDEPPLPAGHDFASYVPPRRKLRYAEYKDGASPYNITAEVRDLSDELARSRRGYVVESMKHAWHGYRTYAFGSDELQPQQLRGRNNWGGMGTTLVDSLSTLWLMGLRDEFWEGRDWVRDSLNHDRVGTMVSVFETTIRNLGGLLSAYDLSGDAAFLEKADDLGSRLMKAFDSPSGVPYGRVNLKTGEASNPSWMRDRASLAEFGTLQIEFRYLAKATGKQEYARKVEEIFQIIEYLQPDSGLIPLYITNTKDTPAIWEVAQPISFGAHGDSAYEYMLKIWLQGGRKEMMYRHMYDKAVAGLHEHLLYKSTPSGLTYVAHQTTTKKGAIVNHSMEHLVCFMSGTLALGAYTDPDGLESPRAQRDLQTAKALAYTCYQMYARMETGISPEIVRFRQNEDFQADNKAEYYILRPETIESFFVLTQLTGDPIYREMAWEIFQSIERYCKTDAAYGGLRNVNQPDEQPEDKMESFFMSETLKYLYLLFDPDNQVDILNKHVFNTEAQVLRLLDLVQTTQIRTSVETAWPYLGSPPNESEFASYRPLGGNRFVEYKRGDSPYPITQELREQSDELARSRREYIVAAMKHAWNGYSTYAFGHDEILPRSKRGNDPWGGMGTTLVDSLDTLWLMGLKDEFWEGRDWVRDHLNHDNVATVSVFETTIRSLGGLLSAFDLSGDVAFLDKADDLGSRLVKAFDSPSGIPYGQVHLQTGEASNIAWVPNTALLAEFGTLQVEFRYLAVATGKGEYASKAERIFEILESLQPDNGLLSLQTSNLVPNPQFKGHHISFGAMGDSTYEYMLKMWLQGGRKEMRYRRMYDKAIQGLHDELLQKSTPSGLTYVNEKVGGELRSKMDHLVCFLSGTLALGAYTDPDGLNSPRAQRDLRTGRALAYTCYQMYARTKTGIAPEIVKFQPNLDFQIDRRDAFYILRPEAVESFFILNQLTGDPIYREWGWEIFKSIERFCKMDVAYGGLRDVNNPEEPPEDRMESFFLAETLKYLYLLNDPDTDLDIMNKHVFNTEAHPLRLLDEVQRRPTPVESVESDEGDLVSHDFSARINRQEETIKALKEELTVAEQTVAAQAAQLDHWKRRMSEVEEVVREKNKEISRLRLELRAKAR